MKSQNKRGCGQRKTDSLYLESEPSLDGLPIEHFLIDPPIPTDNINILWSRNFQLFEKDGITHLIDWVGEQYYESPWDFIEECRRKGASRRANKNFPFEKLTIGKSMIFFAHKKAIIDGKFCPKFVFPPNGKDKTDGKRYVGDISYSVRPKVDLTKKEVKEFKKVLYSYLSGKGERQQILPMKDLPTGKKIPIKFESGLFMRLPITTITYVRPKDQAKLDELQKKNINFKIAEE